MTAGYPVEPIDIHPSARHLDCLFDTLTLTDKVVHAYSLGKEAGGGRDGDGAELPLA